VRKIAGLGLLIFSSASFSQSSVTLYGRLDIGIQYLSNVAGADGRRSALWSADSGDDGASAFGVYGTEDLGSGYKVNFKLADYLLVTNGLSATPFWNNAWVGMSGPFGSFRMGRDDSILKDGNFDYDPFSQQHAGLASLVHGADWPNFSNTFSYYTPTYGGFDAGFQYSLGGVAGQFNSGRADGVQLSYRLGAFSARTIYQEVRDANGKYSDLYTAQRQLFAAAGFVGGAFKVQVSYTYMAAPDAPTAGPRYADFGWLGVTYTASPFFHLTAAAYHIHQRGGQGSATLLDFGQTYNLSKRTSLYTTVGYLINGKNTNFSVVEQPETSVWNPALGHNQLGFYAGIMHYF
jgi:predicted porin